MYPALAVAIIMQKFTFGMLADIICSLGEEPVKLSIEVPRQCFSITFTLLLETMSGLIIKIPLI